MSCRFCESLSETRFTRVYLWPPHGHTRSKLSRLFRDHLEPVDPRLGEGCLVTDISDVGRFATEVEGSLLVNEQQDTRVLPSSDGAVGLSDLARVTSLRALVEAVQGNWIGRMLRERRYKSFTQPIIDLSAGAVFGHEFLLRGFEADGSLISAGAIFGAAREPRVLAHLDRAARLNAVRTAKAENLTGKLFINFTPSAIYEPSQCLRSTVSAVAEEDLKPSDVVFEIVESEKVDDYAHLKGIVNFYRRAGFKIALDDFGTGYNNLASLFALHPDFIKLDVVLTRAAHEDGFSRSLIGHLIATARTEGIRVIAEGVEDRAILSLLRHLGVDFGQGYYFGRPSARPVREIADGMLMPSPSLG